MQQRAPTLLPRLEALTTQLQRTLGTSDQSISTALRQERKGALADLDALCLETTDIGFAALCMGEKPPAYDERCPFRGLHAFQMDDHEFFFGREALIDALQRKIERSNFLALLGASGSGKSSLVLAGLLPRLRQHEPELQVCYMTPGSNPAHKLEMCWLQLIDPKHSNRVLFIDQFEEIFTLCTDPQQRERFLKRLLELLSFQSQTQSEDGASTHVDLSILPKISALELAPQAIPAERVRTDTRSTRLTDARVHSVDLLHRSAEAEVWHRNHAFAHIPSFDQERPSRKIRIIVTMRADFWGECARYAEFKQLMMAHQELITPMIGVELRRTMEVQAAKVGLRFEADLSRTILDDIAEEPGAMPLLQHLLTELWKRRRGRWLRAEEYRRIGGVQKAIAHTADTVYEQLSVQEQALARDLFVRLTRLDDDGYGQGQRDTRQRILIEEMVCDDCHQADIKALLARLADAKLIITSVNSVTQK